MAFLWLREMLSPSEAPSQQLFPQWMCRCCALMGLSLHPSALWGLFIPPLHGHGVSPALPSVFWGFTSLPVTEPKPTDNTHHDSWPYNL